MLSLFILSALTYRKPNSIAILLFSGSLILLIFPHFAFSYSFWLSFFATLYIILYIRDFQGGWIKKGLGVSLSAFAGVGPLISTVSYISPLSILFTPLISPLVIAYSSLGMLSLLTGMTFTPSVDLFNFLGGIFIGSVQLLEKLSLQLYPSLGILEAVLITLSGALMMYFLPTERRVISPAFILFYLFVRSL